jgi:hypothetical protein
MAPFHVQNEGKKHPCGTDYYMLILKDTITLNFKLSMWDWSHHYNWLGHKGYHKLGQVVTALSIGNQCFFYKPVIDPYMFYSYPFYAMCEQNAHKITENRETAWT